MPLFVSKDSDTFCIRHTLWCAHHAAQAIARASRDRAPGVVERLLSNVSGRRP